MEALRRAMLPCGRWHISPKPVTYVKRVGGERVFKPCGLWYGIGDSWLEWMESEMPDWLPDPGHFLVEIGISDEVLVIDNDRRFAGFRRRFEMRGLIDWVSVAREYSGIEISPYFWEYRMLTWYYPWDCASGVIWRPSGGKVLSCRRMDELYST